MSEIQFCAKIIECGKANFRIKEMSFIEGFKLYILSKSHLRKDSLRDIKYLGNRLIKKSPELAARNFSNLSVGDCEMWLNKAFSTPSQYNKGRAFLHAIFEFALRRQWCSKNPIKCIERKRVIEREILPLSIEQVKKILENAGKIEGCLAPAALMIFAGIRPREVRRLCWRDVDLSENTITVRSICSKTGGVRHVEIFSPLKKAARSATIRAKNLPQKLAKQMAQNPRRFGLPRRVGTGRSAPYLRKLLCKKVFRLAPASTKHGALKPLAFALALRQPLRSFRGVRQELFQLKKCGEQILSNR